MRLSMIALGLCMLIPAAAQAQNKYKQDVKAIKDMCGCYKIGFNYSEVYAPDKEYEFKDRYRSGGLEWVELVEEKKGKIVLQHLLVSNDTIVVKHWRQDWLFENTEFYLYEKDFKWKYVTVPKKEVKGQWTQRVFQVDDSPRYEGTATWVHVDGKRYWENVADSPLPRREFTVRNDYNVLKRRNRHELLDWGWTHEQDNEKIARDETGTNTLISREKGWNTYEKVDDALCAPAQKWWLENQAFWASVRSEWDQVFAAKRDLQLKRTVDNKPLFMHIFPLKNAEEVKPVIEKFVVPQ